MVVVWVGHLSGSILREIERRGGLGTKMVTPKESSQGKKRFGGREIIFEAMGKCPMEGIGEGTVDEEVSQVTIPSWGLKWQAIEPNPPRFSVNNASMS